MRARNGAAGPREDRGATATRRVEAGSVGARHRPPSQHRYVNLHAGRVLLVHAVVII